MEETQATKTIEVTNTSKQSDKAPRTTNNKNNFRNNKGGKGNRKGNKGRGRFNRRVEYEEQVVNIARVTKVTKGGRKFSFSALVVIGDKKGKVGYGTGKANEVPAAIQKAIRSARQNIITVAISEGRTVPHIQVGKFLASQVMVKPAPKGKGIIASGSVRAVIELAGYKDIYTKSLGSRNKANATKAAFEALRALRTPEQIAKLRDITLEQLKG